MQSPPPLRPTKLATTTSPIDLMASPPPSSPVLNILRQRRHKTTSSALNSDTKPIYLPRLTSHHNYILRTARAAQAPSDDVGAMIGDFYQNNVFAYWVDDPVDAGRLGRMIAEFESDVLSNVKGLWVGVGLAGGRKGLVEIRAGGEDVEEVADFKMQSDEGLVSINGLHMVVESLKKLGLKVARIADFGGAGGFEVVEQWILEMPVDEGDEKIKVQSRLA